MSENYPIDLLETFFVLVKSGGNATQAAAKLGVNQPAISKRLSALRAIAESAGRSAWLVIKGKRWHLTEEGERVLPAVKDFLQQHRQTQGFLTQQGSNKPQVRIAAGQHFAQSLVCQAVIDFLASYTEVSVSLSTLRGKERIAGVAGGLFDFAFVNEEPSAIHRLAGGELYCEDVFDEPFVVYADAEAAQHAAWGKSWQALQAGRGVRASQLVDLPLVLPESDSALRQRFDQWIWKETAKQVEAIVESGGWQVLQTFVANGVGVGLFPVSALSREQLAQSKKLSAKHFPPEPVRMIARKVHGAHAPDISEMAGNLSGCILTQVQAAKRLL